jgi:4-amino-4-deoxy-L-arabinose transferase-like glycosyltransferase
VPGSLGVRRPVVWCVFLALPLLIARTTLLGLADPSEARYGQICREMAESGDWVVPTWLGIPHLEKPPLAYWSGALGIRLFGRSELPARLGALVALIASAIWTAGIARRVAGQGAAAPAALAMLLAPFPVMAGAACHTDPFLLAATALFYHSVFRRLHDADPRALDAAALALALGILAKGHMILLFTVVPLAFARTGIFRELWRVRRVVLLLAVVAPWFAVIETRFPGFFRQQASALVGRATGSGHRAPMTIYAVALAVGLLPFVIFAPRGLSRVERSHRRILLLWLFVPLAVLSAAQSRLWTYILSSVPPVAILAGARLAVVPRSAARWPGVALLACGAALVIASVAGAPASARDLLPVAGPLGVAVLVSGIWVWAARPLPRAVVAAGASTIVLAGIVAGAYLHEGVFRVHRTFAHEVADLAKRTGSPVVLAGMSLPSMGFYSDAPVRIAGESGPLAREAETWGRSPLFTPETDLKELLATDRRSVIVVKDKVRLALAPDRVPLENPRAGELVVLGPDAEVEPVGPVR